MGHFAAVVHQPDMTEIATEPANLDGTVQRAARGDEAAFASLVSEHHASMARVAFVICGDAETTRDAVQSAWAIAWRRIASVRDPSEIRAWLVAVAANEARQAVRRQRRIRIVDVADAASLLGDEDPADRISVVDLRRVLVWMRTRADAGGRELATIPEGHAIGSMVWSRDGRTIAAIEYVRNGDPSASPPPLTQAAVRLIDVATGNSRMLEAPPLHRRQMDDFTMAWSPDGRRLAITMGNGEPDGGNDGYSNSFDTVIVTIDGSAPAFFLKDARGVTWSLDSRSVAYIATTGSIMFHEGVPPPPTSIIVIDADGSGARTIVGPTEIVTPLGEPSAWFVWSAPD